MSRMSERRRLLFGLFEFPQEPTSYSLIGTYTSTQNWSAPEDGWFQIEVYGASGHGGKGNSNYSCSGGGGGGGGLAVSRIKLKKDEIINLTVGGVGSTAKAVVNGSLAAANLTVTSAGNGGDCVLPESGNYGDSGSGGNGGTASGGNYANYSGSSGEDGKNAFFGGGGEGGPGGKPGGYDNGYSSGNFGGKGGNGNKGGVTSGESGKAAFVKIYRGEFNK